MATQPLGIPASYYRSEFANAVISDVSALLPLAYSMDLTGQTLVPPGDPLGPNIITFFPPNFQPGSVVFASMTTCPDFLLINSVGAPSTFGPPTSVPVTIVNTSGASVVVGTDTVPIILSILVIPPTAVTVV